jgi:hypothetical protein
MPVPLFLGYVLDISRGSLPDQVLRISDYRIYLQIVTIDVIFHELADGGFGTHRHWIGPHEAADRLILDNGSQKQLLVRLCCKRRGSDLIWCIVTPKRLALFRGRHFEDVIILLCVRWYLRYSLTYR